jgi:hypothetical protein
LLNEKKINKKLVSDIINNLDTLKVLDNKEYNEIIEICKNIYSTIANSSLDKSDIIEENYTNLFKKVFSLKNQNDSFLIKILNEYNYN